MDKNELSNDKPGLQKDALPVGQKNIAQPSAPAGRRGRFGIILRRVLFSLLGALILFLVGMLVAYLVFARPARVELDSVSAELEQEKSASEQLSVELRGVRDNLAALEMEKKDLQAKLASADLYIAILNALTDAQSARLELAARNKTGASLALSNLARSLKTLESMVLDDQKAVVVALQEDLQVIMNELSSNPSAAQSGLDRLTGNLMQLKTAYLNIK